MADEGYDKIHLEIRKRTLNDMWPQVQAQQVSVHNPDAREPQGCPQCLEDIHDRDYGMNRTCCDSPINAYHSDLCPHARWNPAVSFSELMARMSPEMPGSPENPYADTIGFAAEDIPAGQEGEVFLSLDYGYAWPGPEVRTVEELEAWTVSGRRNGKSIAYLMRQQRLLQYYAAEQVRIYDNRTEFTAVPEDRDVDRSFENEFRMQ